MSTGKTKEEMRQEIQALNQLLLEQKDHINAVSAERDKYKSIAKQLVNKAAPTRSAKEILRDNDVNFNDFRKGFVWLDAPLDRFESAMEEYAAQFQSPPAQGEITSRDIVGNVKERFEQLKEYEFQWYSFYHGWLEGRAAWAAKQIKDQKQPPAQGRTAKEIEKCLNGEPLKAIIYTHPKMQELGKDETGNWYYIKYLQPPAKPTHSQIVKVLEDVYLSDNTFKVIPLYGRLFKAQATALLELYPSPDRWVKASERLPELIEGKDYSANVFVICEGILMVMCYCYVPSPDDDGGGFCWANCYGDINGDGEFDDDYTVTHWMPLPTPPVTE